MRSFAFATFLFLVALPLASSGIATKPDFGTAGAFAVLAQESVSNTGPTVVVGSVGTASASPTAITGFSPNTTFLGQVAANNDAKTAYGNLLAQSNNVSLGPQLGFGLVLFPGVYSLETAQITGNLTLDAQGNSSAVWVFQIASTLVTATSSEVHLANGASACGVFWAVGSSASLGINSTFQGTIAAYTSITVSTSAIVNGSLYGTGAAVTLDTNTITYCYSNAGTTSLLTTGTTAPLSTTGAATTLSTSSTTTPAVSTTGTTAPLSSTGTTAPLSTTGTTAPIVSTTGTTNSGNTIPAETTTGTSGASSNISLSAFLTIVAAYMLV